MPELTMIVLVLDALDAKAIAARAARHRCRQVLLPVDRQDLAADLGRVPYQLIDINESAALIEALAAGPNLVVLAEAAVDGLERAAERASIPMLRS